LMRPTSRSRKHSVRR